MNFLTKRLSSKYVIATFLVLFVAIGAFILSPSQEAHAQTAAPTSSNAPNNQDANLAQQACLRATGTQDAASASCSIKNNDGSVTSCSATKAATLLNNCKITYPDGSYTTIDEGGADGSWVSYNNANPPVKIGDHSDGFFNIIGQQSTGVAVGAKANPTVSPPDPPGCNILSPGSYGACVTDAIALAALGMLTLMGVILGYVGSLFNWIVVITVFQFGNYFGNSAGLLIAWGILRDVGNILLLFGFIFMGVVMILDLHTIDTRKAIPQLIVVAVLLNFSLFAAEAVIDVSNVLSAAIYNQAGNQCTSANANDCANKGISSLVINATGINGIFSSGTGLKDALSKINGDPTHEMLVYIGLALFVTVTWAVMLWACIMLIIRGVVLTFVMVLAPLGFAAMAIPPFASLGKQWRDLLISNAFFAPVYLLLLLVSLKIMEAVKTSLLTGNSGSLLDALNQPSTTYGTIFLVFALVIGFMIAAILTAKKVGALGADFATSAVTKTARTAFTAPLRMGAYSGGVALRGTLGAGAAKFGHGYDAMIGNLRARGGVTGGIAKGFDYMAGGAITGAAHTIESTKFGGARSHADEVKYKKERDEHTSHAQEIAHLKKQFKDGLVSGRAAGGDAKENLDKFEDVERAMQKMPQADLEKEIRKMSSEDLAIVSQLVSADKAEKIMDSKELSTADKERFIKARAARINELRERHEAAIQTGTLTEQENTFKALSLYAGAMGDEDRKLLAVHAAEDFSKLSGITNTFSEKGYGGSIWKDSQIDSDIRSKTFIRSQKAALLGAKRVEQLNAASSRLKAAMAANDQAAQDAQNEIMRKLVINMGKDLGKAKTETILAASKVAPMGQVHLASIVTEGEMKLGAEKDELLRNIQAYGTLHGATPAYSAEWNKVKNFVNTNNAAKGFFGSNNGTLR